MPWPRGPRGPRRETDVAGAARPGSVAPLSRDGWFASIVGGGVSETLAAELVGRYDGGERGPLVPGGGRRVRCSTPLRDTLRHVVGASTVP